jgi:hypothetical protein
MRLSGCTLLALLGVLVIPSAAGAAPKHPAPPRNPHISRGPDATMHGDSEASDTIGVAGPGRGAVSTSYRPLAADCPTVLIGADGFIQAVCVNIVGENPTAYLIDPATTLPVASLRLTKGGLLGGIYSYLDNHDRLVITDGSNSLMIVSHRRNSAGAWQFAVTKKISLSHAIAASDSVVGLTPSWDGHIWFASAAGVVGTVNPSTGAIRHTHLPKGETVANSIASGPKGVAIVSTRALYEYRSAHNGVPHRQWRRAYNAGTVRKPGQLSKGSGATPTFFGPRTGAEYVAITDNADRREHLLVYSVASGSRVCRTAVVRGTENSPVGFGRSVYVASTYGYPYPAVPAGAGPASPATAPFTGGLTRVEVRPGGHGCTIKWTSPVRSASVPKLSRADGLIYTTSRSGASDPSTTSSGDRYDFVAIKASTGQVVNKALIGYGSEFDPVQQAGAIDRDGTYYQGVLTGIVRVAAG